MQQHDSLSPGGQRTLDPSCSVGRVLLAYVECLCAESGGRFVFSGVSLRNSYLFEDIKVQQRKTVRRLRSSQHEHEHHGHEHHREQYEQEHHHDQHIMIIISIIISMIIIITITITITIITVMSMLRPTDSKPCACRDRWSTCCESCHRTWCAARTLPPHAPPIGAARRLPEPPRPGRELFEREHATKEMTCWSVR